MSRHPRRRSRSSAGSAGATRSGGGLGGGRRGPLRLVMGGNAPLRVGYPRDLVGYGKKPPDPKWPVGARLALPLFMNYDEEADHSILSAGQDTEAYIENN